uniref:DJ-1/PfpI family protein n=1 Tax=Enterococcus faecalis TaxID=1351 RepID=UPI00046C5216
MKTIYIYVLDTLADWEIGYVTAELNSKRFFKSEAPLLCVKTVGYSKDPISTMGGIQLTPDCLIEEIELSKDSVLLLPGADTWNDSRHHLILNVARELL